MFFVVSMSIVNYRSYLLIFEQLPLANPHGIKNSVPGVFGPRPPFSRALAGAFFFYVCALFNRLLRGFLGLHIGDGVTLHHVLHHR